MLKMWDSMASLAKRINVPVTASWTDAMIAESKRDPWSQSGKYAAGWVYFSIILLVLTTIVRCYNIWGDKIRISLYKEDPAGYQMEEYELPSAATDSSTAHFFPARGPLPSGAPKQQSSVSTVAPLNNAVAFVRWIFYRPIPVLRIWKLQIVFPSLGASFIVLAALIFVILYCFLPQPLYYTSIAIGSPPLAIRAGMIAVALVPWIVALSTKANFITMLTGIGHERLNVLHRWAGYLCLLLSLIHMIPFYITPVWEDGALYVYEYYFPHGIYIYGTGFAALAPLIFLCIHSLPVLRAWMYELFAFVHLPVSIIFVAMLFWHSKNFLTSWSYLWATIAIWAASYLARLCFVNWINPLRMSFMIGEESGVTILPENAIKVTIPTQMRWKPGQYVYLRMPGISLFESHPFTIASLCSSDFPSQYGEEYRDMTLVFRPFGGFTRKVFRKAYEHGPFKTWTAFLEGPYGGMRREMSAFDDVIFFAGGSGITALASQLLYLIKKIRDRKAVTKRVRIIWSMRTPECMEWFKEELRICRDYAPPNFVHCHFFMTGPRPDEQGQEGPEQPNRDIIQEKIYDMLQGMDKRSSAYIQQAAAGDAEREKELRRENEDAITELPKAYTVPQMIPPQHFNNNPYYYNYPSPSPSPAPMPMPMQNPYPHPHPYQNPPAAYAQSPGFNFGITPAPAPAPNYNYNYNYNHNARPTPRFAALPTQRRTGWKTDYHRPNIPEMLTEFSKTFGRRACVFVCGPPSMRVEVADTVARLQSEVMRDPNKDEIYLHAENYNV